MITMLVAASPQSLHTDGECFTPLHAMVSDPNENINNVLHVINFLIEVEPSLIRAVDKFGRTPLLVACCNKHITLDTIQCLYNAYREAIHIPDTCGWLPIHELAHNIELEEAASVEILQFMLNIDPTVARERIDDGCLPIHHAIDKKATDFCKLLIDVYPESLRVRSSDGILPIHCALKADRADVVDTIEYMLDLYPQSIDATDRQGLTPFHRSAQGKRADIVELLLKYDPDAASKASRHRTNSISTYNLPLHLTCASGHVAHTEMAEVLFDACPQAIFAHNDEGKTPLDLARERETRHRRDPNESVLVYFLQTQQAYARQAQDIKTKTTIDKNDWLSFCCALRNNASLGSIELLVRALRSIGHTDSLPLNIACEFRSVKVVRYLTEADSLSEERLASLHLVHSACCGGNLEVIKYFLDEHISLVSSAEVNEKGELPIHLLCEAGKDFKVDIDSTEYIEIIWRMLLANPEVVAGA